MNLGQKISIMFCMKIGKTVCDMFALLKRIMANIL